MNTSADQEIVISNAAAATTKAGAFTGTLGWVVDSSTVALFGLLVAVLSFGVNLYFLYRRDQREAQLHRKKMLAAERAPPDHE